MSVILPKKLAQYIKELGLSYKETGQSFVMNCPLCGGRDKLYIRKNDGRFRCFRCATDKGFCGNVEYAIIELTNEPLKKVRESLYGSAQERSSYLELTIKDFLEPEEETEEVEEAAIPVLTWPYHCVDLDLPGCLNGRNYLEQRGVSTQIAREYKIRYSPSSRAIVFPVYFKEDLVGWQYRTIDKTRYLIDDKVIEGNKAWSSPNLPRDKVFMFSERLYNAKSAVLCEGPFDALKCHMFGQGNVAAMGKSISLTHIAILLRSGVKNVYSGLDPDAFAELDVLLSKLGDDVNLFKINLPESKNEKVDLGSLSMEEARQAILSSEPMFRGKLYIWLKPLTF